MEEIYTFIQERLNNNEDLETRFNKLEQMREAIPIQQNFRPPEFQELSHYMQNLKRNEKLRTIKENDLLEIVFSLRNFEHQQRLRFQEKSYELMQIVKPEFTYAKYKLTGETKDIAKLYLNFFMALKLQSKVDDLKRAYANNKFIGYPIISILMKWFVEVTRKHFLNFLKEKSDQLSQWMLSGSSKGMQKQQQPLINQSSYNPKGHQQNNTSDSERNALDTQDTLLQTKDSSCTMTKGASKAISDSLRKTGGMFKKSKTLDNQSFDQINTSVTSIQQKTIEYNKPTTQETISAKSIKPNIDNASNTSTTNIPSTLNSSQASNSRSNMKSSSGYRSTQHRFYQPVKEKQNSSVEIFVSHQTQKDPTDILDDLDNNHVTTAYQYLQLYKPIKKYPNGTLMAIDVDKKKEMVATIYKNLCQRNGDIDRTVNNYKQKLWDKNKLDFCPQLHMKRIETFCENYNIDFVHRYPHVLPQNNDLGSPEPSKKGKKGNSDGGSGEKFINPNSFRANSVQPKRIHSKEGNGQSANNLSAVVSKDSNEETKLQAARTKTEEPQEEVKETTATKKKSKKENQFRIMKKKMSYHQDTKSSEERKKFRKTGANFKTLKEDEAGEIQQQSSTPNNPLQGGHRNYISSTHTTNFYPKAASQNDQLTNYHPKYSSAAKQYQYNQTFQQYQQQQQYQSLTPQQLQQQLRNSQINVSNAENGGVQESQQQQADTLTGLLASYYPKQQREQRSNSVAHTRAGQTTAGNAFSRAQNSSLRFDYIQADVIESNIKVGSQLKNFRVSDFIGVSSKNSNTNISYSIANSESPDKKAINQEHSTINVLLNDAGEDNFPLKSYKFSMPSRKASLPGVRPATCQWTYNGYGKRGKGEGANTDRKEPGEGTTTTTNAMQSQIEQQHQQVINDMGTGGFLCKTSKYGDNIFVQKFPEAEGGK